jgi:hypothetical protein
MDDQEFATSILYRLAYGIAADRVEASRSIPLIADFRGLKPTYTETPVGVECQG